MAKPKVRGAKLLNKLFAHTKCGTTFTAVLLLRAQVQYERSKFNILQMHEQNCGMDVHLLASKLTNKKHKLMITSQTSVLFLQ